MSGHDSKYFSTTKKGEIPELKEELNSQYKVLRPHLLYLVLLLCPAAPADWLLRVDPDPGSTLLGAPGASTPRSAGLGCFSRGVWSCCGMDFAPEVHISVLCWLRMFWNLQNSVLDRGV